MIYNETERALVTKQIFDHYNTNLSLEIISEVEQSLSKTYIYTKTDQPQHSDAICILLNYHRIKCTGLWHIIRTHLCLLSKIDQIKLSQQTGCDTITGYGHALLPSYLHMMPEEHFSSFKHSPRVTYTIKPDVSEFR